MKKLFFLLLILPVFAFAQYPPTFWPSVDKVSLDFRFEPPLVDTSISVNPTGPFSHDGAANSITSKTGKKLCYFLDTTFTIVPGLLTDSVSFFDKSNKKIFSRATINFGLDRTEGCGFLNFDDTTQYLFVGTNDFFDHGFWRVWGSGRERSPQSYSYVSFYKLQIKNDSLNGVGQPQRMVTYSTYPFLITDSMIFDPNHSLFFKKNKKTWGVFPSSQFDFGSVGQSTPAGGLYDKGLSIVELDRNLKIIDHHFFKFCTDSTTSDIAIFPLAVSKTNKSIVVQYFPGKNNTPYGKIDSIGIWNFDDNMNLLSKRALAYGNFTGNTGTVFSPNDSFIYVIKLDYEDFYSNSLGNDSLYQINVNTGKIHAIQIVNNKQLDLNGSRLQKLMIAPNGKIYIRSQTGDAVKPYRYQVIDQPNREYPACHIRYNVYKSDLESMHSKNAKNYISVNKTPVNPFYVYAEPLNSDCRGIHFINKSDSNFKTFVWYWGDGDSTTTLDTQKIVLHSYNKNGTYFLKVKGIIPEGYWAWYSDSVTYMKPNFYTNDSLGCQWIEQSFFDSTFSNPYYNGNAKWFWRFGDGDTAITNTKYIKHVFKTSGTFNVTMKINYDYCTDSVTKTSVIKILPAPKAGFTLDKTFACIPATFSISDTLTQLVVKKTYNLGDGKPDSIITNNSFKYTYNDTGKYTIKQTLFSPSGCVSNAFDTVTVYKNLINTKPVQPIVTINNEDKIFACWKPEISVKSYYVFKGTNYSAFSFLKNTTDTFLLDSTANDISNSTFQYALKYYDQCSNYSTLGNFESTILLKAVNNRNAYSSLIWNRNNSSINSPFELLKWRLNDTITIPSINETYYADFNFYSDNQEKTCYRLHTTDQNGVTVSSNSVCLNYVPVAIIPTLFDINIYNDGLPIRTFYIKDFAIDIFDYSGKLVFRENNPTKWYGNFEAPQYYFYRITGIDKVEKSFNQTGKILLLK